LVREIVQFVLDPFLSLFLVSQFALIYFLSDLRMRKMIHKKKQHPHICFPLRLIRIGVLYDKTTKRRKRKINQDGGIVIHG